MGLYLTVSEINGDPELPCILPVTEGLSLGIARVLAIRVKKLE